MHLVCIRANIMNAMNDNNAQSQRCEQTRQHIYETALNSFRTRGYARTTMQEIAVAAGLELSLCQSYFPSKEAVALALYGEHVQALTAAMDLLPAGQLAERYHQTLRLAVLRLSNDREAMKALFGAAMIGGADLPIMDGTSAERLSAAYHRLVLGSDDALREETARDLGSVLFSFHMLLLVFWLYDRTPVQASTGKLLDFVCGVFESARPLFFLSAVPRGIARLAAIVGPRLREISVGTAAQDDARDGQQEDFDIHRD